MTDVWIATCTLAADTPSKRFWGTQDSRVSVRLLLRAPDAATFAANIRKSVEAGGARLEAMTNMQTVAQRYDGREMSEAMRDAVARADTATTLMVSRPAPAPAQSGVYCKEIGWPDVHPGPNLWAVLDGVAWPGLPQLLEGSGNAFTCLYSSADVQILAAAPWLVRLDRDAGVLTELRKRSGDLHSGIILRSRHPMEGLRRHLRRYTMLPTPIGGEVPQYFRFYDPRVMLDAMTAMTPDLLGQMLEPFETIIAPLSPLCLLPDGTDVTAPPDVFSEIKDYDGRLAHVTWGPPVKAGPHVRVAIDDASFARFGALQLRRSVGRLARKLHDEADGAYGTQACMDAAEAAPKAAALFNMHSKLQVTTMARAILHHGPDFWMRLSEAQAILTKADRLPWQRKDDLAAWLARVPPSTGAALAAGGLR
ncbi:DUF4123 domain-containing protein [Jannaschia pohangensis]|uniref:DUF4123 domain-containing protein n=1 Tax=Jannaschia pohangensis TaxID=390807 RepID=A0A1I3TLX2_9RHOB|nr:DUF4123 domain-containing protein [Jannaschia pohangensis]SFJ70537.1 protein of unknown function [Jannaschia pohangensis]